MRIHKIKKINKTGPLSWRDSTLCSYKYMYHGYMSASFGPWNSPASWELGFIAPYCWSQDRHGLKR
jgi:hypothetical protein